MKHLVLLFFILPVSFVTGQHLVISNGKQEKTFKTGTYVRADVTSAAIEPCYNCKDYYSGKILSFNDGILTLEVRRKGILILEDGQFKGFGEFYYAQNDEQNIVAIEAQNILALTKQGSKNFKRKSTGETIGNVAMVVGLSHLVIIPLLDEDRATVGFLGGAEFVCGALASEIFDFRKFKLKPNCPEITFPGLEYWYIK